MISDVAGSMDREVKPFQERLKASAGCWLSLAAAPAFAVMAVLTAVLGGGAPDMLCSAVHGVSPLSGMLPMYALMSAFHLPPWLKRVSGQQSGALKLGALNE